MRNLHFLAAAAASLLAFALPLSVLAGGTSEPDTGAASAAPSAISSSPDASSQAAVSPANESSENPDAGRTAAFRISGTTTDDYTKLVNRIQEELGHPAPAQRNSAAAGEEASSTDPVSSAHDEQNTNAVQFIAIDLGPFTFLNQKIVDVLAQYPQAAVMITDEDRALTVPAGFEWIKSTDVTGYVGVNRLGQLIDQDRVGLEEQEAGIGIQIISPDDYAAAGLQPPADLTTILQDTAAEMQPGQTAGALQ